jgi:hypothetical protein
VPCSISSSAWSGSSASRFLAASCYILNDNPEYVRDGLVTPEGIAKLKEALPFSDFSRFEQDPNIHSLFTVSTITNYVRSKLPS